MRSSEEVSDGYARAVAYCTGGDTSGHVAQPLLIGADPLGGASGSHCDLADTLLPGRRSAAEIHARLIKLERGGAGPPAGPAAPALIQANGHVGEGALQGRLHHQWNCGEAGHQLRGIDPLEVEQWCGTQECQPSTAPSPEDAIGSTRTRTSHRRRLAESRVWMRESDPTLHGAWRARRYEEPHLLGEVPRSGGDPIRDSGPAQLAAGGDQSRRSGAWPAAPAPAPPALSRVSEGYSP